MLTLNLLLRRSLCRSPPHLRLLHHSSSSPLFNTSLLHNNNNNRSHSIAPPIQLSFPRHFSTSGDYSFPQSAIISLLDSYHDATGFPWWLIITSSAVATRLVLLPVTILQMKKMKRIGEMMPKLPPPFPPPRSRISFRDQMSLFSKARKAAGCPSFFWIIAAFATQAPCFILWLVSIRAMSLGHHSGFDCGGALWFRNLIEYPNGLWGPILPLVAAGLHFTNVQMAFRSSHKQLPGSLGALAKLFRVYLEVLTLPIMFTAFNVPQGSLVYWLTNSSLTLIQTICLSNPDILAYLGMPERDTHIAPLNTESPKQLPELCISTKNGPQAAQSLSPVELYNYSVKLLADGRDDTAINFLRIALEKDPGHVEALLLVGKTLAQREQFLEAIECYESAISKLLMAGSDRSEKELDLLIFSSQLAGIANMKLGKMDECLHHLERVAQLDEPENPNIKARYYGALLLLSSAFLNLDRKDEARKCLQKAVDYDPQFKVYLKQLDGEDSGDFAVDLASSRRDV